MSSRQSESLKICYLLETTDLSGGVRVVFDQVRALAQLGHQPCILARHGFHQWYPYDVPVQYVSDWKLPTYEKPDILVGTFWTTIDPALQMKAAQVVHLCQGCEWNTPEFEPIRNQIEAVYAYLIPKITIGDWLTDQIEAKFGSNLFPVENVGQIVDIKLFQRPPLFQRIIRRFRRPPFNILIVGMFEAWVKGISVALSAIAHLRHEGIPVRLIRVATTDSQKQEETITPIDEFYWNVPAMKMVEIYHKADIFLASSRWSEGFGLPFAEALACGLPAVATAIPSYMSFDSDLDYACFVTEGDSMAMASTTRQLISDPGLQNQLSRRGHALIQKNFDAKTVAKRLESFFKRLLNE